MSKQVAIDDQLAPGHEVFVSIKSVDAEKRLVTGLVYEPNVLDTWGEMMLASDIELMAHRFMETVKLEDSIDVQHDNKPTTCRPVESFIARKNDPDFAEGSWVVTVKVHDDNLWARVKSGDINGFSYQCLVRKIPAIVEVESPRQILLRTEEVDNHSHFAYVEVDDAGKVIGGRTDVAEDGHFHIICGATATEPSHKHSHRFFV